MNIVALDRMFCTILLLLL